MNNNFNDFKIRRIIDQIKRREIPTFTYMIRDLINLIKRFKFEELEVSVMPVFREMSWTKIKNDLISYHKKFTSANVAQFIKQIITDKNLSEKVLENHILTLKLIDISWHNKRITWFGYKCLNYDNPKKYFLNREIQNKMQDYFHFQNLQVIVKANAHEGITYVAIFEKGKKIRRTNYIAIKRTTYFALFAGQDFFFSSRKYVSTIVLNALLEYLGYTKCKRRKLSGKDIKSLSKICWKKMEGTSSCDIDNTIEYENAEPNITKTGVDFSQQQQRKKYAKQCFGDNPPTIQKLAFEAPRMPIVQEHIRNELPDAKMRVSWEFRSKNIAQCLTKLIERRILVTPIPDYMANHVVIGKNEITLK